MHEERNEEQIVRRQVRACCLHYYLISKKPAE